MKLTNEQIEYVSEYVKSFDIKWYELQIEITDHMVTSMEEIWEKDPELTFHQVKHYAENEFGRNGFKVIEEERTHMLKKEFRKVQWKMVAEYLTFPKIVGSILLVIISFKVSFYFENPTKYVLVLFLTLYVFAIPMLYFFHKNRKIDGKRFLAIESVHPYLTSLGVPQIGVCLINPFKEEVNQYPAAVLVFCLIWTLGILFVASATFIQKQTINTIIKQYQLN